jgi:hypothetical protein
LGSGTDDEASIHLSETCVYNITNWTDSNVGFEVDHCITNLSAGGGGSDTAPRLKLVLGSDGKPHGSMQNETTTWSYSAQNPTSPVTRLDRPRRPEIQRRPVAAGRAKVPIRPWQQLVCG